MPSKFAHAMRSAELALAIPLLPPGGRVLELGAGDGWQASLLAQQGFTVTALDVKSPASVDKQYVPVTLYDGRTLPFPDASFDAVFSSNVLEHVKDFDRIQAELARVLTTSGVAVHCLPSTTWRFWTTIGHPVYAIRWILRSRRAADFPQEGSPVPHKFSSGKRALGLLRIGLIAPKHGEQGNLISEHYLFSRRSWKRRFERTEWQIIETWPTGLFYSGNELLGLHIATKFRNFLAKILGSSTVIFVTCPQPAKYAWRRSQ